MRLNLAGGVLVLIALIATVGAYLSLFTVHQTRQALVLQLGNPVSVITKPGLHFKYPFIEDVIYIDNRILDVESPARHEVPQMLDLLERAGELAAAARDCAFPTSRRRHTLHGRL